MFMFDRERNFYVSAIIGGPVAIAVGIAWALKRKGSDQRSGVSLVMVLRMLVILLKQSVMWMVLIFHAPLSLKMTVWQ